MRSDIGNSKNGYQVRKYNDSVKGIVKHWI